MTMATCAFCGQPATADEALVDWSWEHTAHAWCIAERDYEMQCEKRLREEVEQEAFYAFWAD